MTHIEKAQRITQALQSKDRQLYARVEYEKIPWHFNGDTYVLETQKIAIYRHTDLVEYPLTVVPVWVSIDWLCDNFGEADMQVGDTYQFMNNMTDYQDRLKARDKMNRELAVSKEYEAFAYQRSYFKF